jgi:hypothetical protein
MKIYLLLTLIFSLNIQIIVAKYFHPKILHLSFHQGCINDFKQVADELGLDLTSWFVLSSEYPKNYFDGTTAGNAQYNIGHERAERIWNKHKDYFNSFDIIITSDTAPLARIFLQNEFDKPLIIWVCNRFDYSDWASLDCAFPDKEYYELFAEAKNRKNVRIVSYTPYEYFYAGQKGIDIGTFTIKPVGLLNDHFSGISVIPDYINKSETIFIPLRLDEMQKDFLINQCEVLNIPVYCGKYNGPSDLKDFKAIVHFPYAWSNVALFENIQNGLVHFVPTIRFVKQLRNENKPIPYFADENLEWAEWYREENDILFVYFDSWDELKRKIETIDYESKKKEIKLFAKKNRQIMLDRWKEVLTKLIYQVF